MDEFRMRPWAVRKVRAGKVHAYFFVGDMQERAMVDATGPD